MAQSRQIVVALVALPAAMRFDVRARIGESHCRCVEFASADEALAASRDTPPDLFVTGLDAPDFAAWRLCRLLRSTDPAAPHPASVVAISATLITEEARCITTELGGATLLRWPEEADQLVEMLGRLLAPSGSADVYPVFRCSAEAAVECDDAERYRALFANMLDGCALHEMIWDASGEPADYRFLAVNQAFEQMTGLQASRILGKTVLEVLPGTERHWIENYGRVARTGEPYRFEGRHAGLERDYDSLAFRPAPNQFACVFRDVTERQRNARALDRLHHLAEMLGQVNQAIARAQSQEDLFAEICRVSTRFGRFSLTWIGLVDEVAGTLRIHAEDAAPGTSPRSSGTPACDVNRRALAECRPAFCNDLDLVDDPSCPRMAGDLSIRACAAFPLRLRGAVYGTLCVHATEVGLFETEELQLLEEVALDISFALEKLDAEKNRSEVEERFRIAFEHFPTPVTLSAIESGRYLEVNRKFESTFGFSRDEAIGRSSLELGVLVPAERTRLIELLRREGRVSGVDFRMTTRDGRRLDCLLNAEIVTIAGQRRLLSMFIDLSDRKQAEERLRESEALYRSVLNASPDDITVTDLQGRLRMVSPAGLAMFGTDRLEDALGRCLYEFVIPEDRARAIKNLSDRLQGVGTGPVEYRAVRLDGSRFDVEANAEVVRDVTGQPEGFVFVVRDIRERKRVEAALAREQSFSDQIIDAIPGIFFVVAKDRHYVRWNRAHDALFEMSPEQIRQTDCLDRIHPDDRAKVAQVIEEIFARGSSQVEARGLVGLGPETRNFILTGRRVEMDGATFMVGCGIDVTERTAAEQARAVLEERLLQAQKMESVGRLAGGVAHDFNNLLTVINGYSELMLSQCSDVHPLRAGVEEIHKAGTRAAALTAQLLAFSRKQVLQPRVFDLARVVAEMRTMLERLVGEAVELRFEFSPGAQMVRADPHQLQQVVMNLVVNAKDALPRGGKVSISVGEPGADAPSSAPPCCSRPGSHVVLSVGDDGVGMDAETRRRIFEPFFTTKAVGKGTGLGLSMVQGIVAQSGGGIEVVSSPGHGTTFRICLPRVEQAESIAWTDAEAPPPGGEEQVLVVEDQGPVRDYTMAALKAYGYAVLGATSGEEALRILERDGSRIGLVLTDVVMPNMSGRQLAERIEQLQPGAKILFMSGYADAVADAAAGQFLAEDASKFIQKPFSPEQLAAKVRFLLGPRPERPLNASAGDEV